MSLLAARCKTIRRVQAANPEREEAEILSKLVAYTSEQVRQTLPHSQHSHMVVVSCQLMSVSDMLDMNGFITSASVVTHIYQPTCRDGSFHVQRSVMVTDSSAVERDGRVMCACDQVKSSAGFCD